MIAIVDMLVVSLGVILVGSSLALCFALLYLFIRLVDKRFSQNKETLEIEQKVSKTKEQKKKDKEIKEDDIPFSVPIKVETSFENKRIGKV